MSVLACDRQGCENVMCNRYSPVHGYICAGCFEELVQSGQGVEEFMQTTPGTFTPDVYSRDLYAEIFPRRDGEL